MTAKSAIDLIERTAARILVALVDQAITQAEIAAAIRISAGPVSNAVRLLRERRQIYIADYRCTDKSCTAIYKLGNLPDAEKPARNILFLSETGAQVLELLRTGDKSTKELTLALDMNRMRIHDIMVHLRETKQVHVAGMTDGRNPTHIYRAGAGKDFQRARRPETSRKTIMKLPPPDPMMAALFGLAA